MIRRIDIQDIKDFIICPRMFWLKKEHKVSEKLFSSINEKYIVQLRKTIYFLFSQIQQYDYADLKRIKRRWADLWICKGAISKEQLFLPNVNDTHGWKKKRSQDGMDILYRVWDKYGDPKYIDRWEIVVVNIPYEIHIDDDIIIVGKLPIIRMDDNSNINILDFRLCDEYFSTKDDIEISLISLGYRKYSSQIEKNFTVYSIDKKRERSTRRGPMDHQIAVDTCNEVVIAINNGINYRRLSRQCEACPYYFVCRDNGEEETDE